jgi:hypothetical protein
MSTQSELAKQVRRTAEMTRHRADGDRALLGEAAELRTRLLGKPLHGARHRGVADGQPARLLADP